MLQKSFKTRNEVLERHYIVGLPLPVIRKMRITLKQVQEYSYLIQLVSANGIFEKVVKKDGMRLIYFRRFFISIQLHLFI